jgi:alpha-glucosidase
MPVPPLAAKTALRLVLIRLAFLLFAGALLGIPTLAAESTAQPNVRVLAPPLTMPGLDRLRTIRLYLPPSYAIAVNATSTMP